MKKQSKFFISLFVVGALVYSVFATDVLLRYLKTQTASGVGSSTSKLRIVSDDTASFINKDNDSNYVGDYLAGTYFDSALGYFYFNWSLDSSKNVRIVSSLNATQKISLCAGTDGYKFGGYSYSKNFGFVDFDFDGDTFVYICMGTGGLETAYFGGYGYSKNFGTQNFSGIKFSSDDILAPQNSNIKIEGVTTSPNTFEVEKNQFQDKVKILGDLSKSSLKKDVISQALQAVKSINPDRNGGLVVSNYTTSTWHNVNDGKKILNGTVLYFGNLSGDTVELRAGEYSGVKTVFVQGGNVYITGDITALTGDDLLGIVAIKDANGNGGSVYIDPEVTDIHAIIFGEKSLMSFDGTTEFDGSTPDNILANQLYIKGNVFTENTLGGGVDTPVKCPYFVPVSECTQNLAKKYDFNFIRRYYLVNVLDAYGTPTGVIEPANGGIASVGAGSSRSDYAVVIDYNPKIQILPPPFFSSK